MLSTPKFSCNLVELVFWNEKANTGMRKSITCFGCQLRSVRNQLFSQRLEWTAPGCPVDRSKLG